MPIWGDIFIGVLLVLFAALTIGPILALIAAILWPPPGARLGRRQPEDRRND